MHFSVLRRSPRGLEAAVVAGALLLAGVAVFAASALAGPRYEKRGHLYCVLADGDLYTFDSAWRVEKLESLDPGTGLGHVVARPGSTRVSPLRKFLLRKIGVTTLDQIPVEGKAEMDAIRSLGYI